MRNYDLTVLFDVAKGEDEAKTLQDKLIQVITNGGGKIYTQTDVEKISLVSTFKKHTQAYSTRIQYEGNNDIIAGLNREFDINEGIIRQLNTRLESVVEGEALTEIIK